MPTTSSKAYFTVNNNDASNVLIIPTSLQNDTYDGRSLSEQNIIAMLNSITDHHNYVISTETDADNITYVKFVLDGHYIELPFQGNGPLYAKLESKETSGFKYASNLIIKTDTSEVTSDFLQILNSSNEIPAASKIKFNSSSLDINIIDGGNLDI